MAETTLASWKIDKNSHRMLASLIFFIPAAIFIVAFLTIYVILRSTNIILLVIPVILFLPLVPTFRELSRSFALYKENLWIYVTDRGVYIRHVDQGDKHDFLAWEAIKQYDVTSSPSLTLIPQPAIFRLVGAYEDESLTIYAFDYDADILKNYLKEHNVPFGFMRGG